MSIFKYLTLSHLQKVLAALEVRFKGIENNVSEIENNVDILQDSILQSDWDENDSTSPSYIENRTHYRTSLGHSYPLSGNASQWTSSSDMTFGNVTKTYTYCSAILNVTSNQFNHSAFDSTITSVVASVTTNGITTNQTLSVYIEDHLDSEFPDINVAFYNDSYAFCLTIEPNGDKYDHYFDYIYINHNLIGISDDLMEITLNNLNVPVVEEEFEYTKKLDNRYLNGKLIVEGTGYVSEIFNDISNNKASGSYSHAEGNGTTASGSYSHAEGNGTTASGSYSHAEGFRTTASSLYSHAEGSGTTASGGYSHAEGEGTTASSSYSHAEGFRTTASGSVSHAEGNSNTASGLYSHAEGYYTTAQRRSQHVFGEYNTLDTGGSSVATKGTYIEIVGKGTSDSARSNARTLDWSGNEVLAGKLTVGAAPTADMDVATKKYVDDATTGITTNLSGLTDTTISSPADGQLLKYNATTSKWENVTLSLAIDNGVIQLKEGSTVISSVTLPIYNGGVSS